MHIISASRRTDMIKFHKEELDRILSEGYFIRVNPHSNKKDLVNIDLKDIGAVVLWSKDYNNLLKNSRILDKYNLFFQFTITGHSKNIERGVIETNIAIAQMEEMAKRYGGDKINWRFDPIGFFPSEAKIKGLTLQEERLIKFREMCEKIRPFGVSRCMISFMDISYGSVVHRLSKYNITYYTPTDEQKIEFLNKLANIAKEYEITLYSCASPFLEQVEGIKKAHCIDSILLSELFGLKFGKSKDLGQREACGCMKSIDIGVYTNKCGHNCLYCYANPTI